MDSPQGQWSFLRRCELFPPKLYLQPCLIHCEPPRLIDRTEIVPIVSHRQTKLHSSCQCRVCWAIIIVLQLKTCLALWVFFKPVTIFFDAKPKIEHCFCKNVRETPTCTFASKETNSGNKMPKYPQNKSASCPNNHSHKKNHQN